MKHLYLFILIMATLCCAGNLPKPVIIDTDGGIDDMRALVLLLAAPDIRILAITASCGVLSADETFVKVKSLCRALDRHDISVGICRDNRCTPAEFALPREYRWGPETAVRGDSAPDGLNLIRSKLATEVKTTIICLGSLTTAKAVLQTFGQSTLKVNEIVWSADSACDTVGFNYRIDPTAARFIMQQAMPVRIVRQYAIGESRFFTNGLLSAIDSINTPHARILQRFFSSEKVKKHPFAYRATDEMVALYLSVPPLFSATAGEHATEYAPSDSAGLMAGCIEILEAPAGTKIRKQQ